MLNLEQFALVQSAANRFFNLSNGLLNGLQSLAQLNVQAAKATLQESAEAVLAALSAQSPAELVALQARLLQAAPEKAAAYLGHVKSIAAAGSAEARQYLEAATSGAQAEFTSLVETAAKNAPAGTENAVALVKTAVAAATQATQAAQQAVVAALPVAAA